jgi:two-component system, NarL family, response regulator DegU
MKIIVADDHPLFRSGVSSTIKSIHNVNVVAELSNGMDAYQSILEHRPDIAILDIDMPMLSGLDVAEKVMSEKTKPYLIILTMHINKEYFIDAMHKGVSGYLIKDNAIEELLECIKEVRLGKRYVSANFRKYLGSDGHILAEDNKNFLSLLTPTEKVILKLISEGKTSSEISALLFISVNTVDNHRANMTKKLNLEGKNSLLKFSISNKSSF